MSDRKLSSFLSGGIARGNPFEGGADYEAWLKGTDIRTDTWGGYVSRLSELLANRDTGTGLTRDQLLAKLCIGVSELRDSSLHFLPGTDEHELYRDSFDHRTKDEAREYYHPEIVRLEMILDAIMDGYRAPDQEANDQMADQLQNDIAGASRSLPPRDQPDEIKLYEFGQLERITYRDALRSGVVMTLQDFIEIVSHANLLHDKDFKSELAHKWVHAYSSAIRNFLKEYGCDADFDEMSANHVIIGRDVFDDMRAQLRNAYEERREYAKLRWREVEPVFVTTYMDDHPLISRD